MLNLFPRPGLYSSLLCGWPIKTYLESLRNRESLLTRKLLIQGFLVVFRLKQVLRKCYIRHHVFANQYQISVLQKWKRSLCCNHNSAVSGFTTFHQTFDRCNMACARSAAGNVYHSGTPKFNCHALEKNEMCTGYDGRQNKKISHFAIRAKWAEKNGSSNSYLYSSDDNRLLSTR